MAWTELFHVGLGFRVGFVGAQIFRVQEIPFLTPSMRPVLLAISGHLIPP